MSLLLQLNGDLPDRFPGHERRLYVFGCRGKTCQKKDGSISAIRGVRVSKAAKEKPVLDPKKEKTKPDRKPENLGNALFNSNPFSASGSSNPFSTSAAQSQNPFSSSTSSNQFQTANLASKSPQQPLPEISTPPNPPSISSSTSKGPDLPTTFTRALSLSSPHPKPGHPTPTPTHEPWPVPQDFPPHYPPSHLDADYETLSTPTPTTSSTPQIATLDLEEPATASGADTYESDLDKTFQRFADRLAQNPEQVLRYEFGGSPLLYSNTDAVGLLFSPPPHQTSKSKITTTHRQSNIPPCPHCLSSRTFELQLTPGAILELEAEETGVDGMEWGAVIVGVCARDCALGGVGEVGYGEEWVGVQWEEGGGR